MHTFTASLGCSLGEQHIRLGTRYFWWSQDAESKYLTTDTRSDQSARVFCTKPRWEYLGEYLRSQCHDERAGSLRHGRFR